MVLSPHVELTASLFSRHTFYIYSGIFSEPHELSEGARALIQSSTPDKKIPINIGH